MPVRRPALNLADAGQPVASVLLRVVLHADGSAAAARPAGHRMGPGAGRYAPPQAAQDRHGGALQRAPHRFPAPRIPGRRPGRSVRGCDFRERKRARRRPIRRGKGTNIVAVAAGNSLPLVVSVQSASPANTSLWKRSLPEAFSMNSRPDSSATMRTTRTCSTPNFEGIRNRVDRAQPATDLFLLRRSHLLLLVAPVAHQRQRTDTGRDLLASLIGCGRQRQQRRAVPLEAFADSLRVAAQTALPALAALDFQMCVERLPTGEARNRNHKVPRHIPHQAFYLALVVALRRSSELIGEKGSGSAALRTSSCAHASVPPRIFATAIFVLSYRMRSEPAHSSSRWCTT